MVIDVLLPEFTPGPRRLEWRKLLRLRGAARSATLRRRLTGIFRRQGTA